MIRQISIMDAIHSLKPEYTSSPIIIYSEDDNDNENDNNNNNINNDDNTNIGNTNNSNGHSNNINSEPQQQPQQEQQQKQPMEQDNDDNNGDSRPQPAATDLEGQLEPQPDIKDPNATAIRIRMPNGSVLQRFFSKNAKVSQLYIWCKLSLNGKNVSLLQTMPRLKLDEHREKTLKELGLIRATLVCSLDD